MAGGNTPRQKMINMMYLVLTAMLALNVSAEVLDAFAKIEGGLERTIVITSSKNENTLKIFEEAVDALGDKAVEWKIKADSTRQRTKELSKYIQELKIELIKEADGKDTPGVSYDRILADSISSMDNKDASNRILLGSNKNGKAYDLLPKVIEYKDYLVSDITGGDQGLESLINGLLDFSYPKKGLTDNRDWQIFTFDNTPVISAVALLSKIQVDVLNTESSVLDFLRNQIGKDEMKISSIEAAVNNPNGLIMKGSTGEAEVFLVAFDESIQATANVGGRSIPMRSGRAKIPFSGTSLGPNTMAGYLTYVDGTGTTQRRDFKFEYNVVEPSMAVSATKMNVFYLGVDNPVDISVSGVPQSAVKTNITNGTLTQAPGGKAGEYIVRPTATGKCNISVVATVNGETKDFGTKEFRVKRVPDPTPSLFSINGRTITRSQLSAVQGMVAKMPEDFDFDLKYDIVSFKIEYTDGGYNREASSSTYTFSSAQRDLLNRIKADTKLMITNIKAKGPDGQVRDLLDLVYTVR